ncbi:MAG: beta-ketoacyl-ACP synthase II [Desulfovibrionaceae bacterium]
MSVKRVVITGLSALTPIGDDLDTSWSNLLAGVSGIGPVTLFDTTDHATKIAGEVKNFNPEQHGIPFKAAKRMDRFCQFAVAASNMLMRHAGWTIPEEEEDRVGCIMGCGLGGLQTIEIYHEKLMNDGPKRVSPFMIPVLISNMAPGQVSIFHKCRGPNMVTTSACASGTHGIGTAYSEIKLGRADAMITGGVEATVTPLAMAGFNALKALSTRNDDPDHASRPFDKDRDGFVMGEGSGMLLIESLDHAKARGATIYAEIVGYGASSDAFHMTAPDDEGRGMALAMRGALREAGVAPEQVEHINGHATSTELNDRCETKAIKQVFGGHAKHIAITANKSMIGHLLGAAGGVEAVFSAMSLYKGVLPGTRNLVEPGEGCDLDYMGDGSRQKQVEYVLSNSFGFGGTNGCLLFKRYED